MYECCCSVCARLSRLSVAHWQSPTRLYVCRMGFCNLSRIYCRCPHISWWPSWVLGYCMKLCSPSPFWVCDVSINQIQSWTKSLVHNLYAKCFVNIQSGSRGLVLYACSIIILLSVSSLGYTRPYGKQTRETVCVVTCNLPEGHFKVLAYNQLFLQGLLLLLLLGLKQGYPL